MTRQEIRLTLRPTPRLLRAARRWFWPGRQHTEATSKPRRHLWFAVLVPYPWRAPHRWWANRHHLFWLPCPLCGRPYGGHEWRSIRGLPDSVPDPLHQPTPGSTALMYVGICPSCTRSGRGVRA